MEDFCVMLLKKAWQLFLLMENKSMKVCVFNVYMDMV